MSGAQVKNIAAEASEKQRPFEKEWSPGGPWR